MSIIVNDPEDPIVQRLHAKRLISRDIDQMLGICEFALQDGCIDTHEASAILDWLNNHRSCLDTWPANVLYDRLRYMLADHTLDDEEQRELLSLVMSITRPREEGGELTPSSLPLDTPQPALHFEQKSFCFTGVFDFGSRADCHSAVEARGGIAAKGITKKLHYLVIGNIGSEVWKHTSFGNKIAKAVEYRDQGVPLSIIGESHWASFIK